MLELQLALFSSCLLELLGKSGSPQRRRLAATNVYVYVMLWMAAT